MKNSAVIILLIFLNFCGVFSQDSTQINTGENGVRFGLSGVFSMNYFSANFSTLPGIPNCCPKFEQGRGSSFAIVGNAGYSFDEDFGIHAGFGYFPLNGTLERDENTTVILEGTARQGVFRHTVTLSSDLLVVEPALTFEPLRNLRLYGGVSLGFPLRSAFSQEERIVSPASSGTFADSSGNDTHSRIRNAVSGNLPDAASPLFSPYFGLSYDLPVNAENSLYLSPNIFYYFPSNPIISGVELSFNSLRAGLGIQYTPAVKKMHVIHSVIRNIDTITIIISDTISFLHFGLGKERATRKSEVRDDVSEIITTIQRTDTVVIHNTQKRGLLTAEITEVEILHSLTNIPQQEIVVEEFQSRIMTPLLSYIFFDENSADIPRRYSRISPEQTITFDPFSGNSSDKLSTYYSALNILGHRLRENPAATLIITGCNQDLSEEKNNLDLSRKRAENVASYLTDVWGISRVRLTLQSRNLPAQSTPSASPEAAAENRRVEIVSTPVDILSPVISDDTLRRSSAGTVRFRTQTFAEAGAEQYDLTVENGGREVMRFSGQGAAPTELLWSPESDAIRADAPVTYQLSVRDSTGNSAAARGALAMNYVSLEEKRSSRNNDKQIDLYSLILFDVRSAELTAANKKIAGYIAGRLSPRSTVIIRGYTDKLGEAGFNRELALKRAQNTAAALGLTGRAMIEGVPQAELYDNTLPEGRFYTRTVDIIVETPKE